MRQWKSGRPDRGGQFIGLVGYYIVGDDGLSDTTREDDDFITVVETIRIAEIALMYWYIGRGEKYM